MLVALSNQIWRRVSVVISREFPQRAFIKARLLTALSLLHKSTVPETGVWTQFKVIFDGFCTGAKKLIDSIVIFTTLGTLILYLSDSLCTIMDHLSSRCVEIYLELIHPKAGRCIKRLNIIDFRLDSHWFSAIRVSSKDLFTFKRGIFVVAFEIKSFCWRRRH